MGKEVFDFIRKRINEIDTAILSVEGSHHWWEYDELIELMNNLEKEYEKNEKSKNT